MAVEAKELRPGGEAVVTRLADIVVIQAIRSWMAQDPAAQTGLLGALQDKQIGRALALVHRDPSHPWTVDSLANEVASFTSLRRRSTGRGGTCRMAWWLWPRKDVRDGQAGRAREREQRWYDEDEPPDDECSDQAPQA
jgi:hypothetical protein